MKAEGRNLPFAREQAWEPRDVDPVARDGDGLAVELPEVILPVTEALGPGPDDVILLLLGQRQQLQALAGGRKRLAVEVGPFRETLFIVHGEAGAQACDSRQAARPLMPRGVVSLISTVAKGRATGTGAPVETGKAWVQAKAGQVASQAPASQYDRA
jgi:hypothetical protein